MLRHAVVLAVVLGSGLATASATDPTVSGGRLAAASATVGSSVAAVAAPVTARPSLPAGALPEPVARAGVEPRRVRIRSIGVDAPVQALGLQEDGTLQVPSGRRKVGWFTGSVRPGAPGPAVLAGHASLAKGRAVFWRLRDVTPGAVVEVLGADESVLRFRVVRVEQHPKDVFPTSAVYGPTAGSELRLITCGGAVDPVTRRYLDNIVVYAVRS